MLDLDLLKQTMPGAQVHWLASVDTTMRVSAELAAAGAPEWTVVVADEQTAGTGRYGRAWHSAHAQGLYMTWLLRPRVAPESLPVITLAIGIALYDAVREAAAIAPDLRWPNDLMCNGRKTAGILTQYRDGALHAGIGLNLTQASFPPELQTVATSLLRETGRRFPREALLAGFYRALRRQYNDGSLRDTASILADFTARSSYVTGKRVMVDQDDVLHRGVTAGLTAQGFLLLQTETGETITILAGGVRAV